MKRIGEYIVVVMIHNNTICNMQIESTLEEVDI